MINTIVSGAFYSYMSFLTREYVLVRITSTPYSLVHMRKPRGGRDSAWQRFLHEINDCCIERMSRGFHNTLHTGI